MQAGLTRWVTRVCTPVTSQGVNAVGSQTTLREVTKSGWGPIHVHFKWRWFQQTDILYETSILTHSFIDLCDWELSRVDNGASMLSTSHLNEWLSWRLPGPGTLLWVCQHIHLAHSEQQTRASVHYRGGMQCVSKQFFFTEAVTWERPVTVSSWEQGILETFFAMQTPFCTWKTKQNHSLCTEETFFSHQILSTS